MSAMQKCEQDMGRGVVGTGVGIASQHMGVWGRLRRPQRRHFVDRAGGNAASTINRQGIRIGYDDRSAAGSHKIAIASTSSKITKHSKMYKNV